MDTIKRKDEVLHTASDWLRVYKIQTDYDLTNVTAVCKFRDKLDNLLCEATCIVEDNCIFVTVTSDVSRTIQRNVKKGRYDVFLIGESYTYKVVMGNLEIIHDVSMH